MKLLRIGDHGQERPAVLDDDGVARDLSGLIPDEMLRFFVVYGTPAQVASQLAGRAGGWRQRRVQEVALQISAQSVTSAGLLAHLDQLAGIVASIAAS